MEKNDFRKLSSTERYSFRNRAMSLIKSGTKKKDVALIMGVRPSTISDWVALYKSEGLKGLRDTKRGVKSEDRKLLSVKQE
ncbi:MAG: transposase, partial [Bacteroidia bacterium]